MGSNTDSLNIITMVQNKLDIEEKEGIDMGANSTVLNIIHTLLNAIDSGDLSEKDIDRIQRVLQDKKHEMKDKRDRESDIMFYKGAMAWSKRMQELKEEQIRYLSQTRYLPTGLYEFALEVADAYSNDTYGGVAYIDFTKSLYKYNKEGNLETAIPPCDVLIPVHDLCIEDIVIDTTEVYAQCTEPDDDSYTRIEIKLPKLLAQLSLNLGDGITYYIYYSQLLVDIKESIQLNISYYIRKHVPLLKRVLKNTYKECFVYGMTTSLFGAPGIDMNSTSDWYKYGDKTTLAEFTGDHYFITARKTSKFFEKPGYIVVIRKQRDSTKRLTEEDIKNILKYAVYNTDLTNLYKLY